MKQPAWGKSPQHLVEAFAAAVAELPGAEPRKMFGFPAAFVNGNLFTGLFADRWFVRLSDEDRVALQGEGGASFEPMAGRPMKAYVELPAEILGNATARDGWLRRSLEYATTLPPKRNR